MNWVALIVASVVLAVTPGPGVMYVVTRTLAQGRRAGLRSVAAVAVGNLGNAVGAAFGLAALFAVSSFAFDIVRYLGAAYLIWLGVRTWCGAGTASAERVRARTLPAGGALSRSGPPVFRDGVLVALLNPKTTLFFAAFLPQFIDPAGGAAIQILAAGGLFVVLAALTDAGYVWAAQAVGARFARLGRPAAAGQRVAASIYLGLGAWTAWTGQRPK